MKCKTFQVFVILGAASLVHGALVVNYNAPSSTINTARSADTSTTSAHTWNFSDSALLFDADAANGQDIYGGYSATSSGLNGTTTLTLGTSNLISQTTKTATGTITARLFLLWESQDFLGHTVGTTYTFDSTAASSFTNAANRTNNGGSSYIIRNGSTYYISNTATPTLGVSGTTDGTQLLWATLDIANWANYGQLNPGNNQTLNLGYTASSFTAQTFTDVTAVGIIASGNRANTNNLVFTTTDFQVNLNVVPEPAAALFGGLGLLTLLQRRRA